ncbi:MAG: GIY-YIG nuclease family protein, partial [Cyanobacteria bacterium J083]
GQRKLLKNLARELEEKIKSKLVDRGVNFPLRFNPKIKDQGLLDLKPE